MTIFAAAYLAEVVRGGLHAIPKGQFEGATALGLGYWTTHFLVVLPQAIRVSIPALADPAWPSPSAETYLFIGALYFALAFAFARFADFFGAARRGQPLNPISSRRA